MMVMTNVTLSLLDPATSWQHVMRTGSWLLLDIILIVIHTFFIIILIKVINNVNVQQTLCTHQLKMIPWNRLLSTSKHKQSLIRNDLNATLREAFKNKNDETYGIFHMFHIRFVQYY